MCVPDVGYFSIVDGPSPPPLRFALEVLPVYTYLMNQAAIAVGVKYLRLASVSA